VSAANTIKIKGGRKMGNANVDNPSSTGKKQVPIKEDFFATPLSPPDQVRLRGSKCRACGTVILGKSVACQNCGSQDIEKIVLSRRGKIYSYTIIRYPPLPPYAGPEPFQPFAIAWVELPEGVRILSPLVGCKIDESETDLKVDMNVELTVDKVCDDEEGNELMTYKFRIIR